MGLKLQTALASDTSQVEDRVSAVLTKPVTVSGAIVIPEGAEVVGTVLDAKPSGRVKGRASIALRFNRLSAWHETYDITTARIAREAASTTKKDVTRTGIAAGVGTAIGAIAGGGKGAAIGAAAGGGAGAGVALATKGAEVRLAAGTALSAKLEEPVTIRVPLD